MNHFYERSQFSKFQSNTTYHQLLEMTDGEFTDWARTLRKEVTEQWDVFGTPPVIGRNEDGIITKFKKLKSNPANYLEKDLSGDELSLGIIKNFNKDASVVNQFFPTMLKTKISTGKSAEGGLSIYDHFSDPELEEKFVKIMNGQLREILCTPGHVLLLIREMRIHFGMDRVLLILLKMFIMVKCS